MYFSFICSAQSFLHIVCLDVRVTAVHGVNESWLLHLFIDLYIELLLRQEYRLSSIFINHKINLRRRHL